MFCGRTGIRLDVASVAHPQSNGQVERANGLILTGIKPRLLKPLERAAGAWEEELPSVLWSLRTTPNRSTGFTPFFLVHGAEAVMPTDIEHGGHDEGVDGGGEDADTHTSLTSALRDPHVQELLLKETSNARGAAKLAQMEKDRMTPLYPDTRLHVTFDSL